MDAMVSKKILIILSSACQILLKEGRPYPCGIYLSELAEPLKVFLEHKYGVDFASPGGKKLNIDSDSLKARNSQHLLNIIAQPGLEKPFKLETLKNLDKYDALFIPGGHAPMVDLFKNPHLGKVLKFFHKQRKLTAMICHSPIVLTSAGETYSEYTITCFPKQVDQFLELTRFHGHLPYYIDDELKACGLKIKNTIPPLPLVVKDRELITGQDPFAAQKLAKEVIKNLSD